eukprot:gene19253-biopygen14552
MHEHRPATACETALPGIPGEPSGSGGPGQAHGSRDPFEVRPPPPDLAASPGSPFSLHRAPRQGPASLPGTAARQPLPNKAYGSPL